MSELVDTTEMYLKSIYEMMEDGVTPLRARIVERLGHSGPTVSQTVARMERDGLVQLENDRQIVLTRKGIQEATEVIRKHRLAERLLTDIIGLKWENAHDEACRWEHVMSAEVEELLLGLLKNPTKDPYGNPIPKRDSKQREVSRIEEGISLDVVKRQAAEGGVVTITRIGEPVQAAMGVLQDLNAAKMLPGSKVTLRFERSDTKGEIAVITAGETGGNGGDVVEILQDDFKHFFVNF